MGASHRAAGTASQDAYATLCDDHATAVAVADGHGHAAHFRSGHGARVAVDLAVRLTTSAACHVDGPGGLQAALEEQVGPELLREWRQAVLDHASSVPFLGEAGERLIGSGDDAIVRAYGTTLIALVGTATAVGFAQIGDGDAVAVMAPGEVIRPLPEDPRLDGIHTTSLSQPDARDCLRISTLDLGERPLALAFIVTDGFAAPQIDGLGWWRQVGDELGTHLQQHGSAWVSDKLPDWLAGPAETGGDDTTMALLLDDGEGEPSS